MNALSWSSIAAYCVFGSFVFYQQLHVKNFQGSSQGFALALNVSALLGMLTGLAYLVFYGWAVTWWAPLVVFAIGILSMLPAALIERVVPPQALSIAAFIGWPVAAYFMFATIPK